MLRFEWFDSGRSPKVKPNPKFPKGVDIDASVGLKSCRTDLPYPAKRIGHYFVKCDVCGTTAVVTTAGRPDDPRSVTLPCKGLS